MEVTMEVDLLKVLKGEMTRAQLREDMHLKNADHFRKACLLPAIEKGLIERTIPSKPGNKNQKLISGYYFCSVTESSSDSKSVTTAGCSAQVKQNHLKINESISTLILTLKDTIV